MGCFRHILHIFCPSSRISRLSQFYKEGLVGSLSLSLCLSVCVCDIGTKTWVLDVLFVAWVSQLLGSLR